MRTSRCISSIPRHPGVAADAPPDTGGRRALGPVGTTARLILGAYLVWTVVDPPFPRGVSAGSLVLGLLGLPALFTTAQAVRARHNPAPLDATGPVASIINLAAVAALYFTPSYAPPLAFTSDAAVVFYGTSMLFAALRGHTHCEVLAFSNWLLRRDDHIGCLVFAPADAVDRRLHQQATP